MSENEPRCAVEADIVVCSRVFFFVFVGPLELEPETSFGDDLRRRERLASAQVISRGYSKTYHHRDDRHGLFDSFDDRYTFVVRIIFDLLEEQRTNAQRLVPHALVVSLAEGRSDDLAMFAPQ